MTNTPDYRIQKTSPEFSVDASTKWHVIDIAGYVVKYTHTKRDAQDWIKDVEAAISYEDLGSFSDRVGWSSVELNIGQWS